MKLNVPKSSSVGALLVSRVARGTGDVEDWNVLAGSDPAGLSEID